MKKISRFFATVSATALLATGAVFAPAASALDVEIDEQGVCSFTQTAEDSALLFADLRQAGHRTIALLKGDLPDRAEDIDAIVNAPGIFPPLHELAAETDRLEADAGALGYHPGEALMLLITARIHVMDREVILDDLDDWVIPLPDPVPVEPERATRDEAEQALVLLRDLLRAWDEHGVDALRDFAPEQDEQEDMVYSDQAKPAFTVLYQPYINQLERMIPAYEACVAGEEGSFPTDPGGDEQPGTGGTTVGSSGLAGGFGSS